MAKRRQTPSPNLKQLAQTADKLSQTQKLHLKTILYSLLEASAPLPALVEEITQLESSEQKQLLDIIQALIEASEDESATSRPTRGRGSFEYKMIPKKNTGTKCGPYKYLRYWAIEDGKRKHKSIYIGKLEELEPES